MSTLIEPVEVSLERILAALEERGLFRAMRAPAGGPSADVAAAP
jgi:hypothetical protein